MTEKPRIAVVGAGAVGAYIGGYLSRDGNDVTLIDGWPANVDAINANGLTLSGLTEPECFNAPAKALHIADVQSLVRSRPIDIAIVSVKSYDTAWATAMIKDYLAPTGFVLSLQNCINEETIAGIVGWGRVAGCIAAKIAVEMTGPATVRRGVALGGNKHTVFRVGEPHGRITPRVQQLVTMLSSIDSARSTENLWGERWSKLCANAMGNGVSASTGFSSNEVAREPLTRRLQIKLAGEAIAVGQALGYALEEINKHPAEDWIAAASGDAKALAAVEASRLAQTKTTAEGSRPSMGQDIQKGRRTEIEQINGFIVEKAAEIGLEAPANAFLVEAVKQVERGLAEPSLDRVRDAPLGAIGV
jgi:2-dehydropantoate 2-reductase